MKRSKKMSTVLLLGSMLLAVLVNVSARQSEGGDTWWAECGSGAGTFQKGCDRQCSATKWDEIEQCTGRCNYVPQVHYCVDLQGVAECKCKD